MPRSPVVLMILDGFGINPDPDPVKGNTFAEIMANLDARRPAAGVETRAGGYREASDTIDTTGNRR